MTFEVDKLDYATLIISFASVFIEITGERFYIITRSTVCKFDILTNNTDVLYRRCYKYARTEQ